jgi:hypothetical protein
VAASVDGAIDDAAAFLRRTLDDADDPLTLTDAAANLSYLHRRFGDRARLGWVADDLAPRAVAAARASAGSTDPALAQLPVFARMFDPAAVDLATPPSQLGLDGGGDVTAEGLWCDRHPLPADFAARAGADLVAGGYELTHAAAGLVLATERGCPVPIDPSSATTGLVALLEEPTDLGLEACGMLGYVGEPDLIRSEFVDEVLEAQAADGGWSQQLGGPSTVHATEWGLRCLLEFRAGSDTPRVPWSTGG